MSKEAKSVSGSKKKPRPDKNSQDYHKTKGAEKFAEAINDLSEAIQVEPKDFKLYFHRATLKLNFGDIEGARQDLIMCEMHRRNISGQIEDYPLV